MIIFIYSEIQYNFIKSEQQIICLFYVYIINLMLFLKLLKMRLLYMFHQPDFILMLSFITLVTGIIID
jgi:hypothetical protein